MEIRIVLFGLALYGCVFTEVLAFETVNIVSFNAENLFDIEDDAENPRDNTYLPLAMKDANRVSHDALCDQHNSGFYLKQCKTLDWSEDVYLKKLELYANVIKAMPRLPDVVVIPETENKRVLEELISTHLAASGYLPIQLDTSDKPESRGIDVGFLTKLPIVGTPTAHKIDFKGDADLCGKTRDIVQLTVSLEDGEPLTIFGVHFPSGRSPLNCRIRAFQTVNGISNALPEDSLKVMAGDLNFNCNETSSNAFDRLLFLGNWYVSPVVRTGCDAPGSSKFAYSLLNFWHTWSYLDMILVSKELSPSKPSEKNWFADLGSFQTYVVTTEQVAVDDDNKGYIEPKRFDPVSQTGVSDHWPVGIRLVPRR